VRILERQHQPGGCMQSYRRNGMDYDTGLHYVGGIGEGQVLHEPFKQLGLLSLPWQHLDPDGFDFVTIGSETFPFVEGYDNFLRTMS
jgi:phytoene dehydrogenase-like protein